MCVCVCFSTDFLWGIACIVVTTTPFPLTCALTKCVCFRFIYETERFNGIGELLEILGRYIQHTYVCTH